MTKKTGKSFDLTSSLSNITQSLERHTEQRGEQLRIFEIPLDKLVTAPWNARRYFDTEAVERLGRDLGVNGQIHPILVRRKGELYEIVVGERRFRAAQASGWTRLKAQETVVGDKEAQRISLAENLGREDLNPYEETLGYMQLLLLDLRTSEVFGISNDQSEGEISRLAQLLRDFYRDVSTARNNVIPETEEGAYEKTGALGPELKRALDGVFDASSRMSWLSFVKNRLPLLELPEDVRDALQGGQLEYTKARVIARVADEAFRHALLDETAKENLPLVEVRKRVKDQNAQAKPENQDTHKRLVTRARRVTEAFKSSPTLQHKTKLKKVERLLDELEQLLDLHDPAE